MANTEDYLDGLLDSITQAKEEERPVDRNTRNRNRREERRSRVRPDDDFMEATGLNSFRREQRMNRRERRHSEEDFLRSFEDELSQIEFSIKEYDDYIEKTFYITQDGKKVKNPALFGYTKPSEPNIFKMNDGQVAYRIMHPSEIRSYDYITPRYVSKKAYYDEKKDRVEKNSRYRDKYFVKNLVIENGMAVWTDGDFNHEYSFAVQMIPEDFIKGDEEKLSELNAQSAQKFNSLSESVKKEIEKIQKYRRSKERQYKANLFTEKLNYDNLISKIQGAEERILRLAQGLDSSLRSE